MPDLKFEDVSGPEDVREERPTRARGARGWKPPSVLPPMPEEKGKVFRWIRTQTRGELDPRNLSMRFGEGWTPVKGTEYPDLRRQLPAQVESRFPEGIEIGSVVLCVNSADRMRERREYYAQLADSQITALDNSMFKMEDKRRMPMFKQRKSVVRVGRRPEADE